jgi:hypothetical protein
LAAAAIVAFRAIDVVFAATIFAWVAVRHPRRLLWFLPAPVIVGAALIAYNFYFFGDISGGQAELEKMHPDLHGVPGPWSGNIFEGALGTLFSPSRGLFIFSPWIAIAVAMAPFTWSRLREWPIVRWLLLALVVYFLMLSKYAVWWAGHTFGPRYWIDATPLFGILLALGLEKSLARYRLLAILFALTITISIGIQSIGAFCFPSTWNIRPANVDTHHERLWDWADTELTRCLFETLK